MASQWYPKTELKYDTGRVCEGRPLSALPWDYDRQEKAVTRFKVAARIRCRGAFFGHAAAASPEGLILPSPSKPERADEKKLILDACAFWRNPPSPICGRAALVGLRLCQYLSYG